MNKKLLLYFIFLFLAVNSFSQIEPVDVSDLTFKIGGVSTEEFYSVGGWPKWHNHG